MVFMTKQVLLLLLALTSLATSSWGTSFIQKSFPDAVGDAPVIVRGVIGMSYSDYGKNPADQKNIYTLYELTPSEVFKGSLSDNGRVFVRQMGGVKEGVSLGIPGAARFSRGEEVVLFLGSANIDGSHDIFGLMMGKFRIETLNGEEFVVGPGAVPPQEVREGEIVHLDERAASRRPTYTIKALREMAQSRPPLAISQKTPSKAEHTPGPRATSTSAPSERTGLPSQAPTGNSEPAKSGRWIWGTLLLVSWCLVRRLRRNARR